MEIIELSNDTLPCTCKFPPRYALFLISVVPVSVLLTIVSAYGLITPKSSVTPLCIVRMRWLFEMEAPLTESGNLIVSLAMVFPSAKVILKI